MYVAYSSKIEFDKLIPNKDTVAVTLDSDIQEPCILKESKWALHLVIPFKVMSMHRDFRPADEQARKAGEYLKSNLPLDKNIIIHCQQGEYRSPAVATGLKRVLGHDFMMVQNGKVVDSDHRFINDTFSGRSAGWIRRVFKND